MHIGDLLTQLHFYCGIVVFLLKMIKVPIKCSVKIFENFMF